MKHYSIDYLNEHGTNGGVVELESGDYYHVVYIGADHVWVFGAVCNVGLLMQGYYDCEEYESIDQGLQELLTDLEMLERGEGTSANFYAYNEAV
jgi:hypothetical protein